MSTKGKIMGVLLFTATMLVVIYLSLFTNSTMKNKVEVIEITGNNYFSRNTYMNFAKLNNISNNKYLSLHLIKDRIEKHPFVEKAEVKFKSRNEVLIEITEKKFEGIIVKDSTEYFITDKFELVPIISSLKNLDVPVITDPYLRKSMVGFGKLKNDETKAAFRIIETTKLINSDLYTNLSEVNLRNGRDIVLTFKGLDFPVILGRGNEVSKVFYFKEIWNKIRNKSTAELAINYVDLRYGKVVYIGMADQSNAEKGV